MKQHAKHGRWLWRLVRLLWSLKHDLRVAENWANYHAEHVEELIGENVRLHSENEHLRNKLLDSSSPNTPVTDAEPSTPANTRAQGPRSV